MIRVATSLSKQDARNAISFAKDKASNRSLMKSLAEALTVGDRIEYQLKNDDAVQASATVTHTFGNQTDGDTIQIGNLTLTAKTSGATGPQFNIGASDAASAANMAAAVNANSTLLTASSAAGVTTVKAAQAGTMGNAVAIIITQTSDGMDANHATLTGGVDDSGAFVAGKAW